MGVFPQMRTPVDCARWVHILGVGNRINWLTYQAIITSKYHRLTLPQTEVSHLYNWRYQFSWILAPFLWASVSFLLWDVKSWKNVFLNVPYGCIYSMYTLNLNMAEKFGKFRMFFIPLSCPSEKNWRKYNQLNWCKTRVFFTPPPFPDLRRRSELGSLGKGGKQKPSRKGGGESWYHLQVEYFFRVGFRSRESCWEIRTLYIKPSCSDDEVVTQKKTTCFAPLSEISESY